MSVLQIKTRQIYPLYPSCVNICKTTFHKNDIRFVFTSSCLYDASCLIYVFAFVCYSGVKHILCSVFVLFFVVLFVPYIASFSGLFLYCFSSSCLYPMLPVSLDCFCIVFRRLVCTLYCQFLCVFLRLIGTRQVIFVYFNKQHT